LLFWIGEKRSWRRMGKRTRRRTMTQRSQDVLTKFFCTTTDFALRLPGYGLIPGITIPIISFWDGQPLR
jgi:hypothetical protein